MLIRRLRCLRCPRCLRCLRRRRIRRRIRRRLRRGLRCLRCLLFYVAMVYAMRPPCARHAPMVKVNHRQHLVMVSRY